MKKISIILLFLSFFVNIFAQDVVVSYQGGRQQELLKYWSEAELAYKEGRKQDMMTNLEAVINLSPVFNAYQMLGELYKEIGDIDKIEKNISDINNFIKNNPTDPKVERAKQQLKELENYYYPLKEKQEIVKQLSGTWISNKRTANYSSPEWIIEISKEYNLQDVVPYKFEISKLSSGLAKHLSYSHSDSIRYVRSIQMYSDSLIKMVFTSQHLQVPPAELVKAGMDITNMLHDETVKAIYTNSFSKLQKTSYTMLADVIQMGIIGILSNQQAKKKVSVIEIELNANKKGVLDGNIIEMQLMADHTGKIDTVMKTTYPINMVRIPEDGTASVFCMTDFDLNTLSAGPLSKRQLTDAGYFKALNEYKNKKFLKNWGGAILTIGGIAWGTLSLVDKEPNTTMAITGYTVAAGGIVLWSIPFHRKPIKEYNEKIYNKLNNSSDNRGYYHSYLQFSIQSNDNRVGPVFTLQF